ncbi:DUF1853 family protein [Caldimonas tepidiphila]|uniref:DUF1853 family protein n=1 Tax=Caldimonas tepidiphila TaxID=2315841 RepID=UPI000E5A13E2|nr:DUF1853 family protein [Caldimonas tepidiphila]
MTASTRPPPQPGDAAPGRLAQALRDLRWLLLSPPLLADGAFSAPVQRFDAAETAAIEAWLAQLEENPAALGAFLARHAAAPLRLGRQAERLLEFFLREGPTHRLVAANLPLRHAPGSQPGTDHTTRGEIDYLLEDAAGRPWHWELAVKFFLCTAEGDVAGAADFVGPDRVERLPGKLHKLFSRQLAHAAPPPFDDRPWRPAACTRGWLFYRHDRPRPHCALLAHDHLCGHWIEPSELDALPPGRYLHVPRTGWMAPLRADGAARPWEGGAVRGEIARMWAGAPPPGVRRWPTAQLVARIEPEGEAWRETGRWFVVPEGWGQAPAPG